MARMVRFRQRLLGQYELPCPGWGLLGTQGGTSDRNGSRGNSRWHERAISHWQSASLGLPSEGRYAAIEGLLVRRFKKRNHVGCGYWKSQNRQKRSAQLTPLSARTHETISR